MPVDALDVSVLAVLLALLGVFDEDAGVDEDAVRGIRRRVRVPSEETIPPQAPVPACARPRGPPERRVPPRQLVASTHTAASLNLTPEPAVSPHFGTPPFVAPPLAARRHIPTNATPLYDGANDPPLRSPVQCLLASSDSSTLPRTPLCTLISPPLLLVTTAVTTLTPPTASTPTMIDDARHLPARALARPFRPSLSSPRAQTKPVGPPGPRRGSLQLGGAAAGGAVAIPGVERRGAEPPRVFASRRLMCAPGRTSPAAPEGAPGAVKKVARDDGTTGAAGPPSVPNLGAAPPPGIVAALPGGIIIIIGVAWGYSGVKDPVPKAPGAPTPPVAGGGIIIPPVPASPGLTP